MTTIHLTPAADLVRELPRHANAHVELADGIYFLSDTLRVPTGLTLTAAPGARPVLSGGVRLTGWRVENGRWTLPVDFWFTQLFVNGERRPRARLPKTGFYEFESLPDGRTTEWYKGATRAVYAPGDCARWQHLADARLVALQLWFEIHLRLAAVDEASRMLTFVTRAFHNLHDETGRNARYYVENVLEALTEPGEWCLVSCGSALVGATGPNRAPTENTNLLYYLPRPGETPENTEIIAPRLVTLALLEDCRDVRLEGIEFRHTDWELPAENPGALQAAFIVPGAIQLRRAADCVIQHCTVSQVAGYAIAVQFGSTGNRILDCELHDLGAGGVKIHHERPLGARETEDKAFAGLDVVEMGWAGEKSVEPVPASTEVARCRIHDGGKIFHSAVGVWIGDSGFNHIHHNEIFDFYYTGISCGWSWSYAPTRCIGNVIEYNHVYNIGRKLLSDMGAIYLLGSQPGGVVRGNLVHDVSCYGYGGSGIYPDQGSSFLTIEDNIVHHTQTDALSIHYGQGLTVRNNIFALTGSGLIARGREECVLLGVFERNILYGATPKMLGYNWNRLTTVIFRNNTYWVAGGAPPDFFGMTFAEWMQQGHDTGSVVADPGFPDPAAGNFGRDILNAIPPPRPAAILEPRLELGEPTFPTAADGERLTTFPATLFVNADEPQRLSLTLTNHGPGHARGRGEFVLTQPEVMLRGDSTFDFDLAPGARAVFAVHATLPATLDEALILVRARAGEFPVVGLCLTQRREFCIRRLAAIPDVTAVAAALAGQPASEFWVRGLWLGTLRMAIAGDRLALALDMRETKIQPNPAMPWTGSGIELFFDAPTSPLKAAQYFIWPGGTARMDHATMKVVAETGITVTHQPTAEGYTLMALVPWSYVGAPADATEFRCELHLNTTPPGARNQLQAKLFNASFSWMGMDGWGTVRVK